MASKILVLGAVNGHIKTTFDKLARLQAKTTFSFAIIAGDLFANPLVAQEEDESVVDSLLSSQIAIPLPTYFTVGRHPLPAKVTDRLDQGNGELIPNLYFLGKRSTTRTSEGIRIVILGGVLDTGITVGLSKDDYSPFHTEGDARSLHGANSADILITTNWPSSIRAGSKVELPQGIEEPTAEQCIADLCTALKPRYHFSTTPDAFYEREPFSHRPSESSPDVRPITRFISLASPTSSSRARLLYAFSLDPSASASNSPPPGTTASPLAPHATKRHRSDPENSYAQSSYQHRDTKRRHKIRPPPDPSECFFCLSNVNLATHLITSIATDAYMTLSKGPVPTSSTFPALSFPAHMLIIPLTHAPTLQSFTDEMSRTATFMEMQRYRRALQSMVAEKAQGKLGAVTWEVSRAGGVHLHWQFMPVAIDLVEKGLVEAAFKVEAENRGYERFGREDVGDGASEKSDYFRAWIWRPGESSETGNAENKRHAEGTEQSVVLRFSYKDRFDLQFGRRVMAKLLNLDNRAHWQDCEQEQQEETDDAVEFKKAFRKYDFSIEEQ